MQLARIHCHLCLEHGPWSTGSEHHTHTHTQETLTWSSEPGSHRRLPALILQAVHLCPTGSESGWPDRHFGESRRWDTHSSWIQKTQGKNEIQAGWQQGLDRHAQLYITS